MQQRHKAVARAQLDATLAPLQSFRDLPIPRKGWIRAIRNALGMTGRQFAARLGVTPSRVVKLDESEVSGSVTLKNMRRAAEALNSVFIYAVVPRTSLEEIINGQASAVVLDRYRRVAHTMTLEDQAVPDETTQKDIEAAIEDLVRRMPRDLWDKQW